MFDKFFFDLKNKQFDSRSTNFVIYSLLTIFTIVVFSSAWICDDAYHAFIMAQNLIDGNGFVYNVGYRVNASTCPFFTLLTALVNLVIRDMYLTGVILGTFFSSLTFFLLLKNICKSNFENCILLVCMLSSYSFMSFTTSGLENSALFFLVSIIAIIYFKNSDKSLKTLFYLSLLTALVLGTRMDNILIVMPMLLHSLLETKGSIAKKIGFCLLGFLPFFIWIIFSTWYYGFPFPNTAYAKLNTGFPITEYLYRGLDYIWRSLVCDLVIFATFITLIIVLLLKKDHKILISSMGVFLYVLYVIYIGGDFMAGRHLTVIYLLSLIIIFYALRFQMSKSSLSCFIGITLLFGLYNSYSPMMNELLYTQYNHCHIQTSMEDEKKAFYKFNVYRYIYNKIFFKKDLNILYYGSDNLYPSNKDHVYSNGDKMVLLRKFIFGRNAYFIKRKYHNIITVDMIGLSDELLSRLPAYKNKWRVGHMVRIVPKGYLNTLLTGQNRLYDKKISKYYDYLNKIVSGDLFDIERLKVIFLFNLSFYNKLLPSEYESDEFIGNPDLQDPELSCFTLDLKY
jgi:arabinofuranosyltransferase